MTSTTIALGGGHVLEPGQSTSITIDRFRASIVEQL